MERTAFEERGDQGNVRILVIGDLTPDLLDAIDGFVIRQRHRQVALAAGTLEVASWYISDNRI